MSIKNESINARVNITVDVEKNGAKEKVELPLNFLVLDDFTPGIEKPSISSQEKLLVTRKNVNEVMKDLSPELDLIVENTLSKEESELAVHLQFKKIEDFNPSQVVNQVPALKKILAMRSLLKELRTNVTNSSNFRKTLEKIVNDPSGLQNLKNQLPNDSVGVE